MDIGNIGQETQKEDQQKGITQKTKQMSNMNPTIKPGMIHSLMVRSSCFIWHPSFYLPLCPVRVVSVVEELIYLLKGKRSIIIW